MADKTPVRVVFNSSNVATGMAEFQSGETVPVANGGTGLASIGSAGQVLRTNAAGNALEFATLEDLADIISVGSTLTAPSNADFNITTAGTGNIVLNDLSISDNTISTNRSNDDLNINASGTGTVVLENLKIGTSGSTVTTILDEDNMSSNSDTSLATQQSIKAYVDSQVTAQDLDFATDDSTALNIDLDSETLQVSGGANITTSGSANTITIALDTSLTGLSSVTSTALVTNNISSSDSTAVRIDDALNVDGALDVGAGFTISNGQSITSILDEDAMGSDSANALATQQSIKAYVDTQDANIASDTLTFTNKTFDVEGTGNSISNIDVADLKSGVLDTDLTSVSGSDDTLASAKAIKTYVDSQVTAQDLDFATDDSTALSIDLDSETLQVSGGANISTSGSGNTITVALDTALTNLTSVQVDGVTITDNTVSTNASNSPLELKANGTGAVKVVSGGVTFTLPTTDGSDGDVLKTDGSGTLSFASSTATASDDTRAVVKNNKSVGSSARTIDYFQATSADAAFYFVALSDLTNDHSSASIFTVAHNNTNAFIGAPRGGASGSDNSLPSTTADISSAQVRVKVTAPSADSKLSYYKIPLSTANTSNATSGVTVTTANTDVDSASESIDTFAHASFRAAKYLILVDNDSKTETGVVEALIVHNGTNAFITQYGNVNSGNHDKIVLSAAISGSNVVVSAAGNEPNLSLKIHKTLLADSMTAVENANQKIIGATTVSSSATALDDFDLDDATAAVYYVVGGNSSEGAFSVQEVYCAGAPGEASVSQGPFVSTKGTSQLSFTAAFKSDADNSLQLSVASTSGGSTTVNAYRINCLAE